MKQRGEKNLDARQKQEIASKFRMAILNEDLAEITKLSYEYNPHFLHGAFKESMYYPHEVSVFAFSREIVDNDHALVSEKTKAFIMQKVMKMALYGFFSGNLAYSIAIAI